MSKPTVTAACDECGGKIVVEIPAPVSEYATTRACPTCGHEQRIRIVRAS